jgi:hypothetical protein
MASGVATAVAMLVLFPGFLGLKVLEAITDYRRRTEFDKLGIVVGLSLVVYMVYFCLALGFGLPQVPAGYEQESFRINGWSVLAIALLASAVPLLIGIVMNRGCLSRFNYRGWIADRDMGGPASVWVGAFIDYNDKWVRAHLADGTIVEGYVKWYSDDGEEHEVFLGEASICPAGGVFGAVKGPGVLLGKGTAVSFVEFLDGESSED